MLKQKFAENLKKLRKSRKLTQERLAELVGVDFRYISFIENARSFPSCDLIERLSQALNVTYSEMFLSEDDFSRKQLEAKLITLLKHLDDKSINALYAMVKNLLSDNC